MSTDIEPTDWMTLDPWWSAHAHSRSIPQDPTSERVLVPEQLRGYWDGLDSWWRTYTISSAVADSSALVRALQGEQLTDSWNELDSWWDAYVDAGHETAVQIATLLDQSNDEWADSDALFDTDPLAADLSRKGILRGPLQPDSEVEWSQWLAQLLRPSAALVTELFDMARTQAPIKVVREDLLSKEEGTFRRPDLLVMYADRGVSIEVKLDDENYQKTSETAELVERHYDDREWTHTLLLPKRNQERLASIVEPSLDHGCGGRLTVEWDKPGPINVLYWRDVTTAVRSLLCRGEIADEHWAADAYLFCAIAEQQLIGFQSQLVVERLAAPSNVVDTIQPIGITDTLEEQLTYLGERVDP